MIQVSSTSICNACGKKRPVLSCEWVSCPNHSEQRPRSISEMNGIEFEDFVRSKLQQEGYTRIETTPKSRDFGADLIVHEGPEYSGSSPKEKFCNLCLRKLPVKNCEWKSCPFPSSPARRTKIVVQCKRSTSPVGITAVQEVLGAKSHYKAEEAWVVTDSTFTKAARELAKSCGVRLKRVRPTAKRN